MDAVNFYPQFRHLFILSKDGCSKLLNIFYFHPHSSSFILSKDGHLNFHLHLSKDGCSKLFRHHFSKECSILLSLSHFTKLMSFRHLFILSKDDFIDAVNFTASLIKWRGHLFILSKDGCSKLLSSISSSSSFYRKMKRWHKWNTFIHLSIKFRHLFILSKDGCSKLLSFR